MRNKEFITHAKELQDCSDLLIADKLKPIKNSLGYKLQNLTVSQEELDTRLNEIIRNEIEEVLISERRIGYIDESKIKIYKSLFEEDITTLDGTKLQDMINHSNNEYVFIRYI